MASAREKFNNKGGGVPSLFSYTIKDTQKIGERRFPSKSKYIKNDITISKGIESRDTDLEGFGEVIKKVKKEDVQVPAGAIRKHKMVKQISGRFNSEGKKKGFDIFALIDDAIDKEPTDEAKEKARERAAAKNAVNEPIPPRVVKKKSMSAQPTPPALQTQSTEGETTTKALNQAVIDRHVVDISDAPIQTPASIPAMFTTSTSNSTPKREPAWKLRLQDKKQTTPTSTPVLTKQASSSDEHIERATTPRSVVKEVEASPTTIPAQVVAPQKATSYLEHASSPAASMKETDALKEEKWECKGDQIHGSPPHPAVTKDIYALDEGKPDLIGVSPPVPASKDIDIPKGFTQNINNAPAAIALAIETKPTEKEPAWKLRLQDRQAASSSEIDVSSGTSIDLGTNARSIPTGVGNPLLKKEPAWKLRLQERQEASTIAEPALVAPIVEPEALINHDMSMERGVILEGGNVDTQKEHQNEPPEDVPDDDDFSVSISSVESDQSHNEQIPDGGVIHMETPEQVVVASSQREPESSSSQDIKSNIEISAHLSEKSGGQQLDSYHEPKSYSVQHSACPVEDFSLLSEKHSSKPQSIGSAGPLKAEPMRLPVTLGKFCADSDSSDSSSDDDMPVPKTSNGAAKRKSDLVPEVTSLMQPPKLALGSTASGIRLTEKVDALLARSLPLAPHSGTTSVTGSPSDKLEWLREQIKDTEKKIQATMIDAKLQVAELRKLFDDEKETMQEDFEERTREQRRLNLELDKKHEKLLNEEKKIVESLRAENKMLRANVDRLPKQMAETKHTIANLEAANEEIATHTEGLLRFSKKLETDHEKLMESSRQCRDIYLPRYRTELRERQMALDTEMRIKTLYRDCAIKIAKHVAESSRKPDFVEEINALVLETEAEVNPKFDPRVLVASDSDSSSSSDSDDSSDSDSSSD